MIAVLASGESGVHIAGLLAELGAILLALGILGRIARWLHIPVVPLYLVAGLFFGQGGLVSLSASEDFLVVGAYPPAGTYDECTRSEEHKAALKTIPKVAKPRKDPVFGSTGQLSLVWKTT